MRSKNNNDEAINNQNNSKNNIQNNIHSNIQNNIQNNSNSKSKTSSIIKMQSSLPVIQNSSSLNNKKLSSRSNNM